MIKGFSSDGFREAHDFIGVWSLLHKHPLSSVEQLTTMLQHFCSLSKEASFRSWWIGHVEEETQRQVVHNILEQWPLSEQSKPAPAAVILKNLAACSAVVQRAVVMDNESKGLLLLCEKMASGSKLAVQCLSNVATQNRDTSAAILGHLAFRDGSVAYLRGITAGAAEGKAEALCVLLHNAWKASECGVPLICELLPLVEERCGGENHAQGTSLLLRCILEHELHDSTTTTTTTTITGGASTSASELTLFSCIEGFPHLLGRDGVPARVMEVVLRHRRTDEHHLRQLLRSLGMGTASEEPLCRRGCLELCKGGMLEFLCEILEDPTWEPDVSIALQILGNLIYRNDEYICARLLQLDAFPKILRHSRFNPHAGGPNREWAMVCIRNATEVSPAVHAYLSEMQYLGIDRSDGQVAELEKKMGAALVMDEAGKLKMNVELPIVVVTSKMFKTLNVEDQLLCKCLTSLGYVVRVAVWNDKDRDWSASRAVIVRTIWDYHRNASAFLQWLDELDQAGVPIFNGTSVLRWSHHKSYLIELASALGVPTVPSVLLMAGTKTNLAKVCAKFGTGKHYVMKPCVGSFGEGVVKFALNDALSLQRAEQLQSANDCLVQPFVGSIAVRGELSLIFVDGNLSHAVLKVPPKGDFKVQGGSVTLVEHPDEGAVRVAKKALQAVPRKGGTLMFARVDLVLHDGAYLVSELECLDPELFVMKCQDPEATSMRIANAISMILKGGKF